MIVDMIVVMVGDVIVDMIALLIVELGFALALRCSTERWDVN